METGKNSLLFLGTGTSQGVPVIACPCQVCASTSSYDKRLRCSVFLQAMGKQILIDSGPDFRQQMLRADIRHLDAILFTHEHKDHTAGLDDIRAYNYIQQQPMDVFAEERVQESLKCEFAYIFSEFKYPGIPQLNLHAIGEEKFFVGNVPVIPIRVMHLELPVLGFRFGKLAYVTDANYIAPKEKEKLYGLDCLIINGLRKEQHLSHFTLSEALDIICEVKPKQAYITHLSHQLGFHSEVQAELPPNVFLAYDGLEIFFDF